MRTLSPNHPLSQETVVSDSRRTLLRESVGTELAPRTRLGGSEGASAPYPCLTGTNSITIDKEDFRYLEELRKKEEKEYKEKIDPLLSGYQRKQSQRLQNCIEFACKEYGQESLAVIHLTFAEDVSYQVAQDRMNSLRTNLFAKRYSSGGLNNFITICERGGKNGRMHFHVLVISPRRDYATGTYWSFNKKTKRKEIHPNADCRAEWEFLRGCLEKYKFGAYVRVEPIRSVKGGAKYFSKYVGKGHYSRDESMKGKQLIRYGTGFQKYIGTRELPVYKKGVPTGEFKKFNVVQQINWIGGVSSGRRRTLEAIGEAWGCEDTDELNYLLGSRWQHYAKDQMMVCSCLAGYRIGERSKDVLSQYAKNVWGVTILYGVGDREREVVGGFDDVFTYTREQLFFMSLNHAMDRLEAIQDFQYEDHNSRPAIDPLIRELPKPDPVDEELQENFPF